MNVAQTTRSRHPGAPAETPAWQAAWAATEVIEAYLKGRARRDHSDAEAVAGAMDRVLALRYALVALTVRPVPAQDDPA